MYYVAKLTPKAEGGYSVTFPDIPGCTADGKDKEEALKMAKDALEDTLEEYLDGRPLPDPDTDEDKENGLYPVFINAKLAKKLLDMYKITSIETLEKLDELGFFG
jgi:predicted RNase H-like HicB family nuclease